MAHQINIRSSLGKIKGKNETLKTKNGRKNHQLQLNNNYEAYLGFALFVQSEVLSQGLANSLGGMSPGVYIEHHCVKWTRGPKRVVLLYPATVLNKLLRLEIRYKEINKYCPKKKFGRQICM